MKGRDLLSNYKSFYVEYSNVEGLSKSAAVTINGLVVGKVSKINLENSTGKLIVELQIKTDFPIAKSSIINIYEPGLIGGKQIEIIPNLKDQNLAENGQVFKGTNRAGLTELVSEKLAPIQEKLDRVLLNADKLLVGINSILDKKTQDNIKNSVAELNSTLEQFHKASENVNSILVENKPKINGIVSNFNQVSNNFSKISDSLNKADLGKTAKNLQLTLEKVDKILAGLESGKGSMGKLLKDEALYNNLTKTSNELELLLQDVRLNPTRYINVSVFGKKNKPYVAPANDSTIKSKK